MREDFDKAEHLNQTHSGEITKGHMRKEELVDGYVAGLEDQDTGVFCHLCIRDKLHYLFVTGFDT